ncbi:MAG TPA: histidine kinase [Solirubrobacteraceae bacterium]|jgi:two-component system sensor histidine kinase KdpD|nr:histidine kinase [Solirubrobacteraceae bacterium]
MSDERGHLKVFIGMAPGVGKTFRMLQEGRAEADSGRDVAIGYLEPHGRAETVAQGEGLELIPRRDLVYRGTPLSEMDLPAVLARKPELCLIDELAHTNAPGVEHEKRYEDVRDVIDAGIDVFSTVNVQHLESLGDQITRLTGARVRETIPDEVLAEADEVVLIDITPEALIARLRAGKVYSPDRVHAALSNFFKIENLDALRETALRQVAEDVEVKRLVRHPAATVSQAPARREEEGLAIAREPGPQAIAERLLALVTLAPHSERIVRRAWRSAQRLDAELDVLFIRPPGRAPTEEDRRRLEELRRLVAMLGARLRVEEGEDVAAVAIRVARSLGSTYVLMGTPSERRRLTLLGSSSERSLLMRLLRGLPGVDVRLVADPALRSVSGSDEIRDSSEGLPGQAGEGVDSGSDERFGPPERPEVA